MIRSAIILTALLSVAALPAAAAPSGGAGSHATAVVSKSAKTPIAVGDLPSPVADAIRAHYPHARVSKAFRIGSGSDVRYEVNVKTQKGVKAAKVTLDQNGNVVKSHKKA